MKEPDTRLTGGPSMGRRVFQAAKPEDGQPRIYTDLAPWFHLLTAPEEYADEAELYRQTIVNASDSPPKTVLELGSGGGNNASYLKAHFAMTWAFSPGKSGSG